MRRFIAAFLTALFLAGCEGGSSEPVSLLFPEPPSEEHEQEEKFPTVEEVRARPIVWELEPLRARGGMSPRMLAGVERLLQEHAAELTGVYAARLRANPVCSGVVTAHLTTESGVLLFLSLEENTTGDEALATQLLSRMQGWDWPPAGRDTFRIRLHLRRCRGEGFLAAGSRELRPLPEVPPVEEEKPAEGEAADRMARSEESAAALP